MLTDWPKHQASLRADETAQLHIYRVFVLWMIGNVFFPNATTIVRFVWLKLFDTTSQPLEKYDWGSAILGRIYHSLDVCSRGETMMPFEGMWMVLEHWFYMYFGRCEPVLRILSDPWPRLRLWEWANVRCKVNDTEIGRLHLEIRTNDVVHWDVIRSSQHDLRSDMLEATGVNRTRRILWDPEAQSGYWYLGDRCWRQVTEETGIPANPPPRESMIGVALNVYERFRDAGWPDAAAWVTPCDQISYDAYWRHVGRGHIKPLLYSQRGIDHIGGSAIPYPNVYLHQPPSQEPMDYTQHATQPQDTSYDMWRAMCVKEDLSGFEYVDATPQTEMDMDVQREALVERTPEEWKYMYLKSVKASKAKDSLHNERFYNFARRHMNFTGVASSDPSGYSAPDSQPSSSGHGSHSHHHAHSTGHPPHYQPEHQTGGSGSSGISPWFHNFTQSEPDAYQRACQSIPDSQWSQTPAEYAQQTRFPSQPNDG